MQNMPTVSLKRLLRNSFEPFAKKTVDAALSPLRLALLGLIRQSLNQESKKKPKQGMRCIVENSTSLNTNEHKIIFAIELYRLIISDKRGKTICN